MTEQGLPSDVKPELASYALRLEAEIADAEQRAEVRARLDGSAPH